MNFELQRAVMAYRGQVKVGEKEDGTPIYKDALNAYEFALLMAFTNFARADDPLQEIYPGVELLMKTTHMSKRQIYNVLGSLEEKKFLVRSNMKGHIRSYKFLNDQLQFSTEKLKKKKPGQKEEQVQVVEEEPRPYVEGLQPTTSPPAPDVVDPDEPHEESDALRHYRELKEYRRRKAEQAFQL